MLHASPKGNAMFKVTQIMPANDWYAEIWVRKGDTEEYAETYEPLVCWALSQGKIRGVVPANDYVHGDVERVKFADEVTDFVGYVYGGKDFLD